jgi:hypothetical protein
MYTREGIPRMQTGQPGRRGCEAWKGEEEERGERVRVVERER